MFSTMIQHPVLINFKTALLFLFILSQIILQEADGTQNINPGVIHRRNEYHNSLLTKTSKDSAILSRKQRDGLWSDEDDEEHNGEHVDDHDDNHEENRESKSESSSSHPLPASIEAAITLPSKTSEAEPEDISELNMEFRFDDDTPTTKMTIQSPNISWVVGEAQTHKMIITPKTGTSENGVKMEKIPENASYPDKEFTTAKCDCPPPKIDIDEIVEAVLNSNRIKGEKGDRGERGFPGLSIQGPKGEPGVATFPHHSLAQGKGERGERGPPGFCTPRDCGVGGAPSPNNWRQPAAPTSQFAASGRNIGAPPESLYKIVPGALVFPNRRALLEMQKHSFIGTIAFVEDEEVFYGRVRRGWQAFQLTGPVRRVTLSTPAQLTRPTPTPKRPTPEFQRPAFQNRGSFVTPNAYSFPFEEEDLFQKNLRRRTVRHDDTNSEETTKHDKRNSLVLQNLPLKERRLVALNSPLTGNMGGGNQVNYQCQRQANKADLIGIFRAFHLTPEKDLSEVKFVNLMNQSIEENEKKTLTLYSFNGKTVDANRKLWIASGRLESCRSWSSGTDKDLGRCSTNQELADKFLHQNAPLENYTCNCDQTLTVLCVEFLHISNVNIRHRHNHNKNGRGHRIGFDKYLDILRRYDEQIV